MDVATTINELRRRYTTLKDRVDKLQQTTDALIASAQNQATYIAALANRQQRVNQTIGPLTAGVPVDITITWPNPWPAPDYGIHTQLTTSQAALGTVHATPKAGTKTTTDCVITVLATVAIATAGLDVLGTRT